MRKGEKNMKLPKRGRCANTEKEKPYEPNTNSYSRNKNNKSVTCNENIY